MANKVTLLTGAGGGIGRATALLFAAQGAPLQLVDKDDEALRETERLVRQQVEGAKVSIFLNDVADFGAAAEAVERSVRELGGLNCIVCNAAVRNHQSVEEADAEAWQALFRTNVLGAVSFCRAGLKELRKNTESSVVIVSSCYAVAGRKGMPIYDATKAALLSLTRTLAFESAPDGIRVNAVCPGGTLTPFTIGRGIKRGTNEDDMRMDRRTDSLLERWAEPREIAYPILWLASSEASYITGTTLMVDGGLHIM